MLVALRIGATGDLSGKRRRAEEPREQVPGVRAIRRREADATIALGIRQVWRAARRFRRGTRIGCSTSALRLRQHDAKPVVFPNFLSGRAIMSHLQLITLDPDICRQL
jgi:hypothetical protein